MASYFTKFSVILELRSATEQQYALDLAQKAREAFGEEPLPDDFPPCLAVVIAGWEFETEAAGNDSLWLHSFDGGLGAVCAFIQHLLQKFDPLGKVTFEWSHDCSQPRVDAYGGGAAVITAKEIKTMSTTTWLKEQMASVEPATGTQP
jgi:hypothetical protein